MNRMIKDALRKVTKNAQRYEFYKNAVVFIDDEHKKHVCKENKNNILKLYNYLNSRGFNYLPKLEYCNDDSYVYEFKEDIKTPDEQKMSDLIKLDALLHNKTVYYKDISLDEVKEIYEDLSKKIEDTYKYYDELINLIEEDVYYSPSGYMLARNCSSLFSCLEFCRHELEDWYSIMQSKTKKRVVLLHNNLDPSHVIRGHDNVLISFDKAKRDLPIYDFINLYKRMYDKYDFNELYKEYNKIFPLLDEEKKLMFIILFLPDKVAFSNSEMKSTISISKLCNYLVTTDKLFMENEAKHAEEQNH